MFTPLNSQLCSIKSCCSNILYYGLLLITKSYKFIVIVSRTCNLKFYFNILSLFLSGVIDMDSCSLKNNDQHKNGLINSGLGTVFFQSMEKYHDKILQYLADTDETDTFGEVLTRCIRTALKLREKGITKDDIISSCTHNHKHSIVPFIAPLFLDIKTAHFDPNLSHLDTIHLLKLIKPRMMFVAQESLPFIEKCLLEANHNTELVVFGESKKYSNFSEYLEPHVDEDKFRPVVIDNVRDTAVILFSSGTTGLPKGICLSHYGLLNQSTSVNNGNNNMAFWCNEKESISLLYTTLYWISAVVTLIKFITEGNSRIVCKEFDAAATWRLVEKYKITSMFLAPYHARDFLAVRPKNIDVSSLKFFLTGGAPVTSKLMHDLREALPTANIIQAYGQSEVSGPIAMFNASDPMQIEMQIRKPLSCGRMLPGYKWKIVDPVTEKILGPNQRGEIRFKIDCQMNGYYKMDSSSAYDSKGYIKSGDIAYYDEEDCIYVVDRIKEIFKYKGWHILPSLLEEILLNHPAVKEAVVIGIPHELDGEHPMGIVVLKKGYENVTPEDIELYTAQRVSDTQRLRAGVKIVDEIKRTTTGKLRRNEMKKIMLSREIKV